MRLRRILKRPGVRGVLLGLLCAAVAWPMAQSDLLVNVEEWLQDGCFAFRGKRSSQANIVLVGLDEDSLDNLRKPLIYVSPELAEVVTYFSNKKAAAIGLDLFIPESYRDLPDLQAEQPGDVTKLGQAIQDTGNVVLPEWNLHERWMRPVLQWQLKHLARDPDDPGLTDFGFVNATEDEDVFVRRQQLFSRDEKTGIGHAHFSLALAALARGWKIEWTEAGLNLAGDRVPLDAEQKLRINFVGPPGTFPVLPFKDALAAARAGKALPGGIDPRGAIVIVGTTARSQQDYHTTPYSNTYWGSMFGGRADLMSGSEIHANIAATLLDRRYIVAPPWWVNLLLLLASGAALGRIYARLNVGAGLLVAIGHHFAWKFICLGLFAWLSLRLEMMPMLLLGALLYGVTFLQRWWTLRRMVGVINAESVARLMEDDPASLERQGEDRVVTVLFADVRGFSTFSEGHAAREVVALLNAYFTAVVPLVERHGGTLNQYMGDGIMVIFGSPVAQDDHAARAVRAAVAMVQLVAELRDQWARLDFPEMRIGVGVNTGRAVIGMVGSPRRQDYTAIGDTTNTAARIEAKTRDLDVDILISRSTYLDVPREERAALGCDATAHAVEVKGKAQKIEVHVVHARPPVTATGKTAAGPDKRPATLLAGDAAHGKPTVHAADLPTGTWSGAPANPADKGPTQIGRYRILGELGHGGMGIVYRAEDQRLRREIALKVVRRELAADAAIRARFLREARSAAAVDSDHIVPIYEADETSDGTLYLVMPLLQGETLQTRLANPQSITIAQAVRIAGEMAMGLAAAHARGLIHRDVKPGNIWLERRSGDASEDAGRVKLLDFGLARVAGTTEVTLPGTIVGTPAYMSPEQARGEELDARSDLFSLGTVLYRLVTGRLPFNGENAVAVLRAIEERQPPPPSELRPDVPVGLDDLIGELLAKRPEDRPASAQEVAARLRALL